MVIRRVNPVSAGKVGGVVGVVIGLIVGACFSLFAILLGGAASASDAGSAGLAGGFLVSAGAIVIMPIFYGVFMFIAGLIYAAIYNVAAKWVGGIEIEAS